MHTPTYICTSVCTDHRHPCKVASLRTERRSVRTSKREREIYKESKKLKLNWKTQGCNNSKNGNNNNSKRSSWCGSEYEGRQFSPIGICKAALVVFVSHIDILQTSTLSARKTHTYEMQQQQQQISKTAQRGKYQKWKTTTKQQLQLESCDLMTFFVFVDHYGLHLHTYIASWVCSTHTHTHMYRHK